MNPIDDSSADDLRPVIGLLRSSRPEATALELDAVKQRVRRRVAGAPAGRRARSATFMKSRLAILSMLVAGMLLSTTGAGLAVTSFGSNDASVAQYGPNDNGAPGGQGENGAGPKGGTLGEGESGGNPPSGGTENTGGGGGGGTPESTLQPSRQVETGANTGNLPFTGYLAIPVLFGGIALLSTGLLLRRRTASDRS